MSEIVTIEELFDEGESHDFDVTMRDLDNPQAPLDEATIATLTLKLYDENTRRVLNSRNGVTVKDDNGGELAVGGVLTMKFDPADNVMIDLDSPSEWHVALFQWTWDDSSAVTRTGKQKIRFQVTRSHE